MNAEMLRENLKLRLRKACHDYIDAVERKHALKTFYRDQAKGHGPGAMVKAMGDMSSDMRYKIAKDDWLDAMLEMNATSNALQALKDMF